MLKGTLNFLRANYKRLALLALFSLVIYGSFLLLSYVTNPAQTARVFAGRTGFFFNTLIFVIESVITHYILIFGLILPVMRKQRSFRSAVMIGLLFFLIKFAYDHTFFLMERAAQAREMADSTPAALPEDKMKWVLIMSYVFILIASFSVALLIEWVHKGRERIMLEKDKTEAELKALKHQINPHFLFNSLSFIYGKVIKLDKETADSILMLANIMRYALGKNTRIDGTVNIMDELEHMKNVIEINQRRHNHQLNIRYDEQIDDQSTSIVPLVLITLVENAFKHGDLHDPAHPLRIRINTCVDELTFDISNKKGKGLKELSNGIGLHNIGQQLNLTYGNRSAFFVDEDETHFNVALKITFPV
ncbi:sensor histidine kinase [Dyadobacter fanqingshengii]|uniref:Histidine kinase n=1 Tax=Dyadobacter fanqingshengii TaxID=2906443 RepID=A0A9X1T8Q4_9BACT|nr:histidine kinase [Dyadobacter fanqingshengii]MCF0040400.1 histidine kinase [Dyadobacter fanqingshengii]USJ37858.1 histidine kinase [Dyadobacter fanqingshengii]